MSGSATEHYLRRVLCAACWVSLIERLISDRPACRERGQQFLHISPLQYETKDSETGLSQESLYARCCYALVSVGPSPARPLAGSELTNHEEVRVVVDDVGPVHWCKLIL